MSRDDTLTAKTLLFVNSGGKKKKFTLEIARRTGAQIILLGPELDVPKKLVDFFIQVDNYNHTECIEKLQTFLEEHPSIYIDGAITFWEDDVPLLSRLCEHFGFIGNSYQTAINTRNKYEMRKRLRETGLGSPEFHLLQSKDDLEDAMHFIGFPAVMKPVWGADSQFVVMVKDEEEAKATYEYFQKNCNEQYDPIFKYNENQYLYEEYLDGTEISLECYSQFGIPHVLGINEKQPIQPPYFIEYGDIAPARLTEDIEQEVIKLAESSLIALGVQNSLSHIELKITSDGPKLIEVASRMGGDDIYLNVKTVWGFDMLKIGFQVACGIKVENKKREAHDIVICRYFIPEYSGIITNISGTKECKEMKNVLDLVISKDVGDAVFVPPEGYENMGWIVAKGRSYQEAETVMDRAIKKLEINVTRFRKGSNLKPRIGTESLSTAPLIRRQLMRAAKIQRIRSFDALKKLHIGILANTLSVSEGDKLSKNSDCELIKSLLDARGYKVSLFDMSESPIPLRKLQRMNLDFVLNLCESIYNSMSMEPHAAALMDLLQIPYTGSSSATISQCMDKITVKKLFQYHEIPTPAWDYVYSMDEVIRDDLHFPLIVKPADTDNSYGITNQSVVKNRAELKKQLHAVIVGLGRPALIEEFIDGDEFDVCILGSGEDVRVLPPIRSIFDRMPKGYWHIYAQSSKTENGDPAYDAIRVEKHPKISKKLASLINNIALDVYSLFDCLDYGKVEIRVDKQGNPYVLEVNPNPPIGKEDFMAIAAKTDGYDYGDFIEEILYRAVDRYRQKPLVR
jgi:D-alanine--D-alanine ligase